MLRHRPLIGLLQLFIHLIVGFDILITVTTQSLKKLNPAKGFDHRHNIIIKRLKPTLAPVHV